MLTGSLGVVALAILALVLLVAWGKVHPFLAFILVSAGAALALGIYSFNRYEEQKKGGNVEPETFIGETLAKSLKDAKNVSLTGALAISLGLNQHKDAADEIGRAHV